MREKADVGYRQIKIETTYLESFQARVKWGPTQRTLHTYPVLLDEQLRSAAHKLNI
jgi:hypothetical protein